MSAKLNGGPKHLNTNLRQKVMVLKGGRGVGGDYTLLLFTFVLDITI